MEEMVEINDEKLESYLEKDNNVEDLLENKIKELNGEKQKLSDKYTELKKLEGSYRDKLTRDSSTDEIRKIADEIDKIKEEVTEIQGNIEILESDINKTTETKKETEKSKENYIAEVSQTIDTYEKKLEAIKKAIEICDNDSLSAAYKEEQSKMENELSELKSKREEELDKAVEVTMPKSIDQINQENVDKVIQDELEKKDEVKPNFDEVIVSDLISPDIDNDFSNQSSTSNIQESDDINSRVDKELIKLGLIKEPKIEDAKEEDISNDKMDSDEINKLVEEELINQGLIKSSNKVEGKPVLEPIVTDSINTVDFKSEIESKPLIDENLIVPDIDLSILNMDTSLVEEQKKEETSGREVIDNYFVEANKISQILGSRGVMPIVYDWLDKKISKENNEDKKVVM